MPDAQGQTRGVEPIMEVHDEAAIWKDPRFAERERKLAEVQRRYAWFGEALTRAHADGKIKSEAVRFFITQDQPFLYAESGELVLDRNDEPIVDRDAEPFYVGHAQAYSYVGAPPRTHVIAAQMQVSLLLLDHAATGTVIDVLCADLSALHALELARATV